jgi:phage replication O-like protein O
VNNNYIPNTSAIPNILFDYWMFRLTPAEFKVLLCIARKTYGWHKDVDKISITQIEKMTGLSRKGITQNLESLIEVGLILKIKSKSAEGDDAPNQYEINVNCMGGGSELNTPGVVNSVPYGVVYSVHPQKKYYTKENLQKNNPPIPPSEKEAKEQAPIGDMPDKSGEVDLSSSNQSKKKQEHFPEVLEVTDKIIQTLKDSEPDYSPPKNLDQIRSQVDFMLRLDKREPQKILDILAWALSDSFWRDKMFKPNPAKYLREKFLQLKNKMEALPEKKDRKFLPSSDQKRAYELAQEMEDNAI